MGPPSALWVQRYLREHQLDGLLAEAVNSAVESRSSDPAASLASFFTKLSKRNGEITNISARKTLNWDLTQALEVKVQCFFNGGNRLASTAVGQMIQVKAKEGESPEPPEDEEQPKDIYDTFISLITNEVQEALLGHAASSIRECDDALKQVREAPLTLISFAVADAAAFMAEEPLYLFIAKMVKNMQDEANQLIGGGVGVGAIGLEEAEAEVPKDEDDVGEATPQESGEESSGEFKGLKIRMPVPIFPGITAGREVEGCQVKIAKYWILGKRDAPISQVVPQLISVYNELAKVLAEAAEGAAPQMLADGSYSCPPQFEDMDAIMGALSKAVEAAGLSIGEDITISVNFGASNYFVPNTGEVGTYGYQPAGDELVEADNWPDWICGVLDAHPHISAVEDIAATEDYESWRKVRQAVMDSRDGKNPVVVLGQDLFHDDVDLMRHGIAEGWAAGAVLRPEQLGTLTDVIDSATMFTLLKPKASRVIFAHRDGLKAGATEADIAVGLGAWGIRCGRPDPMAAGKVNRLIEIEEHVKQLAEDPANQTQLQLWEQVYEEEAEAVERYAQEAAEAEQGP